eukprot:6428307-Amphidinium_carterae.1
MGSCLMRWWWWWSRDLAVGCALQEEMFPTSLNHDSQDSQADEVTSRTCTLQPPHRAHCVSSLLWGCYIHSVVAHGMLHPPAFSV